MLKKLLREYHNNTSSWLAGIGFVSIFAFITIFMAIWGQIPSTYEMLSPLIVTTLALTTGITVLLSFLRYPQEDVQTGRINQFLLSFMVAVAYAFVMGIFGHFSSIILSLSFRDLYLDALSIVIVLSSFGSLISYYISDSISRFSRKTFAHLIFIEYVFGFILAAIKTGDTDWWRESICSLGMPVNGAPVYFNFTMILTGLLVWCFYIYLKPTFKRLVEYKLLNKTQLYLVTIFYFSLGAMALVLGLLPYGINETINFVHNLFGYGIYIFVALFMLFAKLTLNRFPRGFQIANYALLSFGLFIFLSHEIGGYLTHGIMELILALVIASWLVIFIKRITILTTNRIV